MRIDLIVPIVPVVPAAKWVGGWADRGSDKMSYRNPPVRGGTSVPVLLVNTPQTGGQIRRPDHRHDPHICSCPIDTSQHSGVRVRRGK